MKNHPDALTAEQINEMCPIGGDEFLLIKLTRGMYRGEFLYHSEFWDHEFGLKSRQDRLAGNQEFSGVRFVLLLRRPSL